MDLLQKLGGRKFLMALIVIGTAVFMEMKSDKGLSPTMASFLITVVSAFHIANYAATANFIGSKKGASQPDPDIHKKLDSITETISGVYSQESQKVFVDLLSGVMNNTQGLKETSAQMGTAVLNLANEVQKIRKPNA